MQIREMIASLVMLVPAGAVLATEAGAQVNQHVAAQRLLEGGPSERARALVEVHGLEVFAMTAELRTALIAALEREGELHAQRRRGEIGFLENPELIAHLASVVVRFDDPRAVSGLVGALGASPLAVDALAGFGESAASAVLDLLSRDDDPSVQMDALTTLRFMVEGAEARSLAVPTLARIRDVAERLLNGRQAVTTLWNAIDLAVALDDPALRKTVQVLATDAGAVRARGVDDPNLIARTQDRARDRLAGVPALPRRRPP